MAGYLKTLTIGAQVSPTVVSQSQNLGDRRPFSWGDTLSEPEDPFFQIDPALTIGGLTYEAVRSERCEAENARHREDVAVRLSQATKGRS
jgi:hypothetical protein